MAGGLVTFSFGGTLARLMLQFTLLRIMHFSYQK